MTKYYRKIRLSFFSYLTFPSSLDRSLLVAIRLYTYKRNFNTGQIPFLLTLTLIMTGRGYFDSTFVKFVLKKRLSKLIFFGLLSFSSSPQCLKDCFLALAKNQLNHGVFGGGQYDLTNKRNSLKNAQLYSCTSASHFLVY